MDKNDNKTLFSFIFGIVFATLIYPIIDELSVVFLSWIEYFKLLPSKLVLKGNKEITKLQDECEDEEETCAIGFQYTAQDEEEYYEDDEEDW